ncbi:MAG: soluble lytic murein transglycosylase [Paraglaciecola sp.]
MVLLLSCLLSTLITAQENTPAVRDRAEQRLETQRKLFIKAEALAHKPQGRAYKKLLAQLEGYPLKPYVELKTLINFPYLANKQRIEHFLKEYENTPLDKPLRKKWLKYLAKNNHSALFLHAYRDVGDARLACKNLQFMLQNNDTHQQALDKIEAFWVVGKSQPRECNGVFDQWQALGLRTDALVWQRLSLAADGGKSTLIPYLKTLLPAEQQYLADLWLKVRRSPSYVSRPSNFPGRIPDKELQILSYGLQRLVWHDRDLALKSWHSLNKRFSFSPEQTQQIASKFAVALALVNHDQAELWLERATKRSSDKELFRWHLAQVIRQQDWPRVMDLIDFAPQEISTNNTHQYWQGRAYEALNAPELANKTFGKLAEQRHYYGFMASGKLAKAPSLRDKPLHFSPQEILSVSAIPAAQRAYELLKLNRNTPARREWNYLQSQLDDQQNLMAAVIADSWGWHDQAIFTFARVGYLDDVSRRFPMGYQQQLLSHAEKHNIDPAWAFAIVRRESSFMADAYSGVGARGLMQIMPGTARYLAKKKVRGSSLYDPSKNVAFGTQYMRYLMDKMDNNQVLVTASYNAGWRRVKQWLPEAGSMPMDIWLETIPYKETRNYVKAVMAYKQIYSQRMGQQSTLFADLAAMQISATVKTN